LDDKASDAVIVATARTPATRQVDSVREHLDAQGLVSHLGNYLS
jgi:hypothetical protein